MQQKKIAIILATYNPSVFLQEQLASIFNQQGVKTSVYVFDDGSTAKTELDKIKEMYPEVSLIFNVGSGSPARNFLRAIVQLDLKDYDYIALSDQDDIWHKQKLLRATEKLKNHSGYSSNLTLYDGNVELGEVVKNQAQTEWDYIFQGGSAGCTYVMSKELVTIAKQQLSSTDIMNLGEYVSHDWALYYICRASKKEWIFDDCSYIYYRQHDENNFGGQRKLSDNFKLLFNGWYKDNIDFLMTLPCSKNNTINIHGGFIYKLMKVFSLFQFRRKKILSIMSYCWWLLYYRVKE